MSQEVLQCWSCKSELDLDPDFDPEDDDHIQCDNCGETCVVVGTRTMSVDQAHESRCESEEARRYEDAAHGRPDSDYDDEPDTRTFDDDE